MTSDADLKKLEQEMGIDSETQRGVDESQAGFWSVKNKEGQDIKFLPPDDEEFAKHPTAQEVAFWNERMHMVRGNILLNKDEQGNPDGTAVAILTFQAIDPKSPNQGKTLDFRVYLDPSSKVKAARTVQRMFKAIGKPVPKDSGGRENVLAGLQELIKLSPKYKVNLWQGWRERWDRDKQRPVPGDYQPMSPRPADFNKRSAFSRP